MKALLRDDHLTGLYNAVITVGNIPYYLFYALTIILLPAISKTSANRDEAETRSLVNKSLRLLALILFPIVTLLSVYAGPVINLFYGTAYADATASMGVFAIGNGFLTAFYVLAFAVSGAGLVRIPMYVAGVGLVASGALNAFLIPLYGIVGSAIATSVVAFMLMVGILIFTDRHFKVRIPLKLWLVSFGSSLILILFAGLLPQGSISFMVCGGVLFLLHFGILRVFGVLDNADFAPLLRFIPGRA